MGELRISVRNMVLLFLDTIVGQGFYNNPQICETLVNVVGFLESLPSRMSLRLALRPGQVNDIKLRLKNFPLGNLFVIDCEDCVASRGVFVHGMGSYDSDLLPVREQLLDICIGLAEGGAESLNYHHVIGI